MGRAERCLSAELKILADPVGGRMIVTKRDFDNYQCPLRQFLSLGKIAQIP